jgi:hypothetical protein
VVTTKTNAPIANARVESFIATATTDSDGRFTLTATTGPTGNLGVTVSANDHRPRETVIGFPRQGELVIDLMSTSAPFDEKFYNQLVRDSLRTPDALRPTFSWPSQLSFYIRTLDETLRPAAPEVLATVRQGIVDGVREFTGGRYQAVIEEGTETRPERVGWVNVELLQVIPEGDYCGYATDIGGNPSTIKLRLDRCGCGSIKIPADLVLHEVGHAVGLFHVEGHENVMASGVDSNCRVTLPGARETYHSQLMYLRPRSNRDPDRDPGGFTLAAGPFRGARGMP